MSARDYALDYSALETGWATQGAADYCTANGHATHRVDGVDTGICPRCLAVTETPRTEQFTTTDGRRALRYLKDDAERGIAAGSEFLIESQGYGASTLTPLEAADVYVSDEGDQGYGDWLEMIEDGVSATLKARQAPSDADVIGWFTDHSNRLKARAYKHPAVSEIPFMVSDVPEPIEGQDAARGILAVNPEAEGSAEWHAWGLGFEYAAKVYPRSTSEFGEQGVYDYPLSGEWADSPTPQSVASSVAVALGFEADDFDNFDGDELDEIADAFELGYATYVAGWRI